MLAGPAASVSSELFVSSARRVAWVKSQGLAVAGEAEETAPQPAVPCLCSGPRAASEPCLSFLILRQRSKKVWSDVDG